MDFLIQFIKDQPLIATGIGLVLYLLLKGKQPSPLPSPSPGPSPTPAGPLQSFILKLVRTAPFLQPLAPLIELLIGPLSSPPTPPAASESGVTHHYCCCAVDLANHCEKAVDRPDVAQLIREQVLPAVAGADYKEGNHESAGK